MVTADADQLAQVLRIITPLQVRDTIDKLSAHWRSYIRSHRCVQLFCVPIIGDEVVLLTQQPEKEGKLQQAGKLGSAGQARSAAAGLHVPSLLMRLPAAGDWVAAVAAGDDAVATARYEPTLVATQDYGTATHDLLARLMSAGLGGLCDDGYTVRSWRFEGLPYDAMAEEVVRTLGIVVRCEINAGRAEEMGKWLPGNGQRMAVEEVRGMKDGAFSHACEKGVVLKGLLRWVGMLKVGPAGGADEWAGSVRHTRSLHCSCLPEPSLKIRLDPMIRSIVPCGVVLGLVSDGEEQSALSPTTT